MKKVTLLLLLAVICMSLVGCGSNKDSEVEAFITENNAVMKDITSKIDANPTAAGVDDAQKSFDAKKAGLKTKWDAVKGASRGGQISTESQKKLTDSMTENGNALGEMTKKHAMKLAQDPAAFPKFQKLMQDWSNTFQQ
jgi:hypothetical protein